MSKYAAMALSRHCGNPSPAQGWRMARQADCCVAAFFEGRPDSAHTQIGIRLSVSVFA
jgi:hypothetical protein